MKRLTITILTALLGIIGATAQNNTGKLDVNGVRDVTLDSLAKANQVRPVSGSSRRGNNPVLFLVGNSTMRNGTLGNGNNGQWGWGYFAHEFFNEDKITVENHALGGTSPRTFYRRLWPDVLKGIQKGDYVILELGHNDNGPIDHDRARSSYKGKDGKQPLTTDSILVTIQETGKQEMVYSFGGYLRRFVNEIRAKGATPILFTLTPRKAYEESDTNRIDRKLTTFTPWIKAMS
jgi:lysophospholipase L1-like esterase